MKAIETKYKGYRFRSRLEARWAVFFDALGIDWEYEPEGYDLGEAGWYLPDFSIKINGYKIYLEVKNKDGFEPNAKSRHIYMAGKVQGYEAMSSTWRHNIADERFTGYKHEFYSIGAENDRVLPGILYAGPHFSDNHGCLMAHDRALYQIRECDAVFAWIDSEDAYGTFVEIGFAHALGKPIAVGFSHDVSHEDMWFSSACAKKSGVFDNAKNAFNQLCGVVYPSGEEEKKVSEFSIYKPITLVMGDPLEQKIFEYYGGGYTLSNLVTFFGGDNSKYVPLLREAAQKARSARFEHGETP